MFISTQFTPQIADESAADPVATMCESILSRFGMDYIDMYWIHNPADVERWTPYLIPLVKSRKIHQVGVSNHNLSQIRRAEEILLAEGIRVSAVQNHYSLLYRSSKQDGILDYCKANDISFWSYMFLEQDALSSKYDMQHPLPAGSQRSETYNPLMPRIERLVTVMRIIGKQYEASPTQVALAWAVAKGAMPIIDVTKVSQVQDAAKATDIILTSEEISLLKKTTAETDVDTHGFWKMPMTQE